MPASSFLYRKVVPGLAAAGLRGIAFDFPGTRSRRPAGRLRLLVERARALDAAQAIDALGVDSCHLVVHDIGGPIGSSGPSRNPDRVLSITVLNTPSTRHFHHPGR